MAQIKSKIYINGRLVGFHPDPEKLTAELINTRRQNKIDSQINVAFDEKTNEVYIYTDAGRVQRPVIVIEKGKSKLTEEIIKKVEKKELTWQDLVEQGIIEYLDSKEEENMLIAETEENITNETTHLEINAVGILSVMSSMIPYLNHNLAGKALHGAKICLL